MQDKKEEDISKEKTCTEAQRPTISGSHYHHPTNCDEAGYTAWHPRTNTQCSNNSNHNLHHNPNSNTHLNHPTNQSESFSNLNNSLQCLHHHCKSPTSETTTENANTYLSPNSYNFKTLPIQIVAKSRSKNFYYNYPNNSSDVDAIINNNNYYNNNNNNNYNNNYKYNNNINNNTNDSCHFETYNPNLENVEEAKSISSVSFSISSGHVMASTYKHPCLPIHSPPPPPSFSPLSSNIFPQLSSSSDSHANYSPPKALNVARNDANVKTRDCKNTCCKKSYGLINNYNVNNKNVKINNNPTFCDNNSQLSLNPLSNKAILSKPDVITKGVNLRRDVTSDKVYLPLKSAFSNIINDKNNNINVQDNYNNAYNNNDRNTQNFNLNQTPKNTYVHSPKATTTTLF